MKCYVDVDQEGNIIDALIGINIIPDKEFDYVFKLSSEDVDILDLQFRYKVIDGELVEKSDDELPEEPDEPIIPPDEPLTLEKLQQEQEVTAMAVMELGRLLMGGE